MNYYRYIINNDELKDFAGEVEYIPDGYIEYQPDGIYYKIKNGKITEVIGVAFDEEVARRRVENFLSGINVNIY